MWNTGEPRRRERDGKKKGGRGRGRGRWKKRRERESAECEREKPSPVKGKDEDGGKSQWPAKVCCPFVTRERVGRYTRESIRLCSKNTRKQTTAIPPSSSPPHRHTATPPIAHFSPSSSSFSFSHAAPVTLVSPLLLAPLCSSKFHRGVPRP